MGVTREDLKRSGRYLQMPDEEWAVELAGRQALLDRLMANDQWAPKIRKKVGIMLTAHTGGLPFLKGSVESWANDRCATATATELVDDADEMFCTTV